MEDLQLCIAKFFGLPVEGCGYQIDSEDPFDIPQHSGDFVHGNCKYHFSVGSRSLEFNGKFHGRMRGYYCSARLDGLNCIRDFMAQTALFSKTRGKDCIEIEPAGIAEFIRRHNNASLHEGGFFQSCCVHGPHGGGKNMKFLLFMTDEVMVVVRLTKGNLRTGDVNCFEARMIRCPYKWNCVMTVFNGGFMPKELAPPSLVPAKNRPRNSIGKWVFGSTKEKVDVGLEQQKMHSFGMIVFTDTNHCISSDVVDVILRTYQREVQKGFGNMAGKRAVKMLETTLSAR
jgi:hypothetical protein